MLALAPHPVPQAVYSVLFDNAEKSRRYERKGVL